MGSQIGNKILKFTNVSKSEIIWRNVLGKGDLTHSVKKFKGALNNLKNMNNFDAIGIASFNPRPFNKYPTAIVKPMIDESLITLQEKNLFKSIDVYNSIIESYLKNNITFKIETLVQEIKNNKIKFNEKTYELLIGHYCGLGQMDSVEHLLNEMQLSKQTLRIHSKMNMIMGYIISGQPEKSTEFITKHKLDANNINSLIYQAYGYAARGDIDSVLSIIKKLKEQNLILFSHNFSLLYWRLSQSNLAESEVTQILDTVTDPQLFFVFDTVLLLNRIGLFNRSLTVIKKYLDILTLPMASDLITSFNTRDCPTNIYTALLDDLLASFNIRNQNHLFSNMSYDEARSFARETMLHRSAYSIYSSLLHRAIGTNSIDLINDSISFGLDQLDRNTLNLILQFKFVPAMLESGTAHDLLYLLELLPAHRKLLLPVVMMYSLTRGNFSEFDKLLEFSGGTQRLEYRIHTTPLVNHILKNLSISEVGRFACEAAKAFQADIINFLLLKITVSRIVVASKMDDDAGVLEAVRLAEKHQIYFNWSTITHLKSHAPRHTAVYQNLQNNVSGMEFDDLDSAD